MKGFHERVLNGEKNSRYFCCFGCYSGWFPVLIICKYDIHMTWKFIWKLYMKRFHKKASNRGLAEPRMEEKGVVILLLFRPPWGMFHHLISYGNSQVWSRFSSPKLDKIFHDYGNFGCIKIAIIFSLILGLNFFNLN